MLVYVIVNDVNAKIYIGKTRRYHDLKGLRQYLQQKWYEAKRRLGRSRLYDAMRKYGREHFHIYPLFHGQSHEEICEHEKLLIKALNSRHPEIGYNLCAGGEGHRVAPSIESRLRMSRAQKGRIPWNKGKTGVFSEEALDKLRKAQTGRKYPPEFGQKVSAARGGIVFSKQHLYNLSESHKGQVPWNKGLAAK